MSPTPLEIIRYLLTLPLILLWALGLSVYIRLTPTDEPED